jgi:ElaB/YqjD/DUF883 family membrane-anchored ribosome-binding protein
VATQIDHEKEAIMAHDILEKQATVEDILRELSRMRSMVTDAVEDGVQTALRAVKHGRETAEDVVKQGRDSAEGMVRDARHAIKRNPLQAAGILFAAGVVIGGIVTLLSMQRD